jgi:urease alpha subunit
LHPLSHILVEEGATLIVDNSTIINAEIIVQDGGSLIIQNNGILQQGENDNVDIQLGGTLQILSGEILAFD